METLTIRFWTRLVLVVITSFIVITYIFKPSDNQCQMTFMMEPPKFIPIPIDNTLHNLHSPTPDPIDRGTDRNYRLFMYSEFGFPLENNIRRDLKDSMPILFVPGNAGSYQQVRSLASTCIRRQLQSLDAFKFIFYTIDFQAQLSGLDGGLVEYQINFVHKAINQIIRMHPTETNGVIVVGHSIGGFIAKALYTRPNFDPNSIPLLINLASPITRSFLNFDDKIRRLYEVANASWLKHRNSSNTLSISISGGKSDRLVPTHLSLDPLYDISLTTNSIHSVWLTTDHVSITWCRELMNKLATMLSALMEKKQTRLIADKDQQLAIATRELLTSSSDQVVLEAGLKYDDQTMVSSSKVDHFAGHFTASRKELIDSPIILSLGSRKQGDLLIWLEHIGSFKEAAIFGCIGLEIINDIARCNGKIKLTEQIRTIPTRKYELKKKAISIKDDTQQLKYIILDFATNLRSNSRKDKIPESISIGLYDASKIEIFRLPTMFEYIQSSLWAPSSLVYDVSGLQQQPVTYIKYDLTNLNSPSQYFSVVVESKSCATSDKPSEMLALLLQDTYVDSSFRPEKERPSMTIRLSPLKSIIIGQTHGSRTYLELYLDGTCKTNMEIKFDMWSFIEDFIQTHTGEILACSNFLAYATLQSQVLALVYKNRTSSMGGRIIEWFLWSLGFTLVFIKSKSSDLSRIDLQEISKFFVTTLLSNGVVALIEYLFNRLVDLAIIVNNFQMLIKKRVAAYCQHGTDHQLSPEARNGNEKPVSNRTDGLDYEWPAVVMTIMCSFIVSAELMKLCIFLMLLKLKLKLAVARSHSTQTDANGSGSTRTTRTETSSPDIDHVYSIALSITTICVLSFLCNIPATLVRIHSMKSFASLDLNFFASAISIVMVKIICKKIELIALAKRDNSQEDSCSQLLALLPKHSHILAMLPTLTISRNIRMTSYTELISVVWVVGLLGRLKSEVEKKKTD